jgi:hypothetical protein
MWLRRMCPCEWMKHWSRLLYARWSVRKVAISSVC